MNEPTFLKVFQNKADKWEKEIKNDAFPVKYFHPSRRRIPSHTDIQVMP